MYSAVLLATIVSLSPQSNIYPDVAGAPYLCCPATCGPGGVVIPFWQLGEIGPSVSEAEEMAWKAYLDLLEEPDKSDMAAYWNKADVNAKRLLLGKMAELKTKTLTVTKEEVEKRLKENQGLPKDKDKENGKDKSGPEKLDLPMKDTTKALHNIPVIVSLPRSGKTWVNNRKNEKNPTIQVVGLPLSGKKEQISSNLRVRNSD